MSYHPLTEKIWPIETYQKIDLQTKKEMIDRVIMDYFKERDKDKVPVEEVKVEKCKEYVDTCKHIRYPKSYKYCPNCGERIIDGSEDYRRTDKILEKG